MEILRRRSLHVGVPSPVSTKGSVPSPLHSPVDLNTTSDSAADRDPKRFANLFGRWGNKSSSALTLPKPSESKQLPAHLPALILSIDEYCLSKSAPSPRRPRHVPIIIPDYASPYDPPQQSQTPTSTLSHSSSIPNFIAASTASSASADATQLDTPPSKSCQKESIGQTVDSKATMNTSQVSLSASESGLESAASSIHQSHSQTNLASATSQHQNAAQAAAAAAANVSGLVCNVHRTTGQEPRPLVGATTTILGDKLYVFGGRVHSKSKPHLSSSLHELDLIKRHWQRLDTTGDVPPPRYFHSMCALGDTKLVCYGGMSPASHVRSLQTNDASADPQPEVVVMGDIHVYDIPSKKWTQVKTSGGPSPEGRYAHCATILPSSAVFATADSHTSAIHHNIPSSGDPHSGTIGVQIDGSGGAEMVVVGGQDSSNNYIQEITVFNLRSLRWTNNTPYDRNCGAYKSMITALPGINAQCVGKGISLDEGIDQQSGTPMLIYSNYNFLDVKLELQIRDPDGSLEEKNMNGPVSPPGLRFPNGGIINGHFVVSGTYLTSSKHEYALWALDLKTLTWAMIDTAGTVFGQGSWNRGILWTRRNSYVILGHRKRNLVDDYNHRRINFAHVCFVELEAYGLYDNPRKSNPSSAYVSNSAPTIPASLHQTLPSKNAGGRTISAVAEQLGQTALYVSELCDMEIVAQGGEHVPCNSSILSRRWGPFFDQLLLDSAPSHDQNPASETTTLRPTLGSRASRISALTITPSTNGVPSERSQSQATQRTLVELPNTDSIPASSRGRALYLPHTASTIKLMLQFLYTSALPPLNSQPCSPHTLCSLLQLARPYQIDGLQEATIERLHEVLDGRNAAAVFNAAAMAAGGGRAIGLGGGFVTLEALERHESAANTSGGERRGSVLTAANLKANQQNGYGARHGHRRGGSGDSTSTATTSTSFSQTTDGEGESPVTETNGAVDGMGKDRQIWGGELSSVIGLQKRGLRGLMEGRRMRERAHSADG